MLESVWRFIRKQLRQRRIAKRLIETHTARVKEREYGRVSMEAAEAVARARQAKARRDDRGYGEACRQAEALMRQRLRLEVGR